MDENAQLTIVSCSLSKCTNNCAIHVDGGLAIVDSCDVSDNEVGIHLTGDVSCEVVSSTITSNNIGINCEAVSGSRIIVQRSNISDNLTYGFLAMNQHVKSMHIFDNYMRENHLSAVRIGEYVHSTSPHGCMIDNIILNKESNIESPMSSLMSYFTGEKVYRFDELDMNTIVHILQFTSFPFGQCLRRLKDIWIHGSVSEYDDYESLVIKNLYGFKRSSRYDLSRRISLLYRTLDMSIIDSDVDLFVCFQSGIIPTVGVTSLQLNEVWIDKNGLKLVELLKDSLSSLTISFSSNLTNEDARRLKEWLHRAQIGQTVNIDITGPMETSILDGAEGIRVLRLRCLENTSEDLENLAQFMSKGGQFLTTLELSYYPLGIRGVCSVMTNIHNCQRLAIVGADIEPEYPTVDDDDYYPCMTSPQIISALNQLLINNHVLTRIDLQDNGYLGDEAVEILAHAPNLKIVNVDACGLTSRSMIAILTWSRSIEKLSIAVNELDDSALDRLLLERNTTLKELDLSGNSSITDVGFSNLMFNRTIDSLSINRCPEYVSDATVQQLSCMASLTAMHISGNDLTDSALLCIKHSKITELDASYNQITDEGAIILVQHPSIRSLNLASNQITWIGARELFQSKTLECLDLSNNADVDDSAISTFRHLQKNTVLKHLELANIEGISSYDTLDYVLNKNQSLEYINLRGTKLSVDVSQAYMNRVRLDHQSSNLRYLGLLEDDDDSEVLAFSHHQTAPSQMYIYLQ